MIAIFVGAIGNVQIDIDSCDDIDLNCEETFSPNGFDYHHDDHEEILVKLLSEEFSSHTFSGSIDLDDWSECGVELQEGWR